VFVVRARHWHSSPYLHSPSSTMKASPLPTEFFAQSSIDKDNMSALPRESCGWLLTSPFTAIVSRMHLGGTPRSQSLAANDIMAEHEVDHGTIDFQVPPEDFQDLCSSSSLRSSGESDSWVMEDMFEPSQFSPTYTNNHSSFDSSLSQLEDEEQIWRMWDTNEDFVSPKPLLYPNISDPVKVRDHGQLGTTRKLPSQIQSGIQSRKASQLSRSSATRSPRRFAGAPIVPTSPVAKTFYSAFPSDTQAVPKLHQRYHEKCDSLPAPSEPRLRPQRSRAMTTPAPSGPSIGQATLPSSRNAPAATNVESQSSSECLFMRSAPVSPQYPHFHERDLMDMMVETSAFSDDEDDENEDGPGFVGAMKSVLNLGRSTSNTELDKLSFEKGSGKVARRNLSDTLNSWFKKKKRVTL